MLSVFNEDTSIGHYSWSVLILAGFILLVVIYNFVDLYRKPKAPISIPDTINGSNKNFFHNSGFFRHIALTLLLGIVFLYGYTETNLKTENLQNSMMSVIEENNRITDLTILHTEKSQIACSKDYNGSIHAALWKDEEGKQQAGLVIGQKDDQNSTCRFAVKNTDG